jgi:glycosyltransferase involved in cell wall biosynthesis
MLRDHPALSQRWAARLAPYFYGSADSVIAVSKAAAADLERHTRVRPERIRVIYNPVITPQLLKQSQQAPPHPWFEEETPIVLGVGRLHPAKDFETLMRAFSIVRRRMACRLVILGEGEERPSLLRLADDLGVSHDIGMPGFVENPFAFMRASSVYVLSSVYEGLPGTLIQAMACGCPVVSTDCESGPSEILMDGDYGHLVPPRNPSAMAGAVCDVLSGHGRTAPPQWMEQFTLESSLRQYIAELDPERTRGPGTEATA